MICALSAFILTAFPINFTHAQVPDIPEPVCVSVPGIPCPDDTLISKEQPSTPVSDIAKNISKLFDYLSKNINEIIKDILGGIRNIFDGLRK